LSSVVDGLLALKLDKTQPNAATNSTEAEVLEDKRRIDKDEVFEQGAKH